MPVRDPRAGGRDADPERRRLRPGGGRRRSPRCRVYDRATGRGGRTWPRPTAGSATGPAPSSAASRPAGPAPVTGRFVVLGVTFRLTSDRLSGRSGTPYWPEPWARTRSADERQVRAAGPRWRDVRSAVLGLRRGKGMVLDPATRTPAAPARSSPTPSWTPAQFAALERVVDQPCGPGVRVPQFPAGDGPGEGAGRLAHRAGRVPQGLPGRAGRRPAGARISTKHTLALVNPGGCAAPPTLLGLAREIRDGVRDAVRGRAGQRAGAGRRQPLSTEGFS